MKDNSNIKNNDNELYDILKSEKIMNIRLFINILIITMLFTTMSYAITIENEIIFWLITISSAALSYGLIGLNYNICRKNVTG